MVSIIIPVYITSTHQLALLDETLRTVAAQQNVEYEVVIVNDGSPVSIAPVLASCGSTVTIHQQNAGSAVARNAGIQASGGETIVFLDADDHLLPGALETGLRHLGEHPNCGFVVGPREEMTFDGEPVPWGIAPVPQSANLYHTLLGFDWYIIPPSSAMFRRDAVEAVGGFQDPWGADDLDFYLRVARRFEGFCYSTPAVTRYRRYSASSSRDGERMLRSIRAVYERQRAHVAGDPAGEAAYARGLEQLTNIFRNCLVENTVDRIRANEWRRAWRSVRMLFKESPPRLGTACWRLVTS